MWRYDGFLLYRLHFGFLLAQLTIPWFSIFTARKRSRRKIIFLHLSHSHSVHRRVPSNLDAHASYGARRQPPPTTPNPGGTPPSLGQVVDPSNQHSDPPDQEADPRILTTSDTQPTGVHPCLKIIRSPGYKLDLTIFFSKVCREYSLISLLSQVSLEFLDTRLVQGRRRCRRSSGNNVTSLPPA